MIAWTVIGAGLLAILVTEQVTAASRRRLALGNDPLDRQIAILASPRWVIPLNLGGWLILAHRGRLARLDTAQLSKAWPCPGLTTSARSQELRTKKTPPMRGFL